MASTGAKDAERVRQDKRQFVKAASTFRIRDKTKMKPVCFYRKLAEENMGIDTSRSKRWFSDLTNHELDELAALVTESSQYKIDAAYTARQALRDFLAKAWEVDVNALTEDEAWKCVKDDTQRHSHFLFNRAHASALRLRLANYPAKPQQSAPKKDSEPESSVRIDLATSSSAARRTSSYPKKPAVVALGPSEVINYNSSTPGTLPVLLPNGSQPVKPSTTPSGVVVSQTPQQPAVYPNGYPPAAHPAQPLQTLPTQAAPGSQPQTLIKPVNTQYVEPSHAYRNVGAPQFPSSYPVSHIPPAQTQPLPQPVAQLSGYPPYQAQYDPTVPSATEPVSTPTTWNKPTYADPAASRQTYVQPSPQPHVPTVDRTPVSHPYQNIVPAPQFANGSTTSPPLATFSYVQDSLGRVHTVPNTSYLSARQGPQPQPWGTGVPSGVAGVGDLQNGSNGYPGDMAVDPHRGWVVPTSQMTPQHNQIMPAQQPRMVLPGHQVPGVLPGQHLHPGLPPAQHPIPSQQYLQPAIPQQPLSSLPPHQIMQQPTQQGLHHHPVSHLPSHLPTTENPHMYPYPTSQIHAMPPTVPSSTSHTPSHPHELPPGSMAPVSMTPVSMAEDNSCMMYNHPHVQAGHQRPQMDQGQMNGLPVSMAPAVQPQHWMQRAALVDPPKERSQAQSGSTEGKRRKAG
eukprot:CAMPEP_0197851504 /NCGR_PEP_ID=MMETSP1438-20131217/18253_1 /TAXON_ID=1461541 /ORGANISM="Pterosperma sp., Strain CCMP1384" /LENGTH=679 /DNA_ID=CAMNT_0043465123 /DNA_START=187 /DNA_END=2222 /DNA_ORIENTATION=-